MSTPIKPSGGGGSVISGAGPEGLDSPRVAGSADRFRAELGAEHADPASAPTNAASNAVAGGRTDALRGLAEELRAGRTAPDQAVERLLERTLSAGLAAGLSPARRAELETLLRTTLAEDPTMIDLQRDLTRAR